MVRPYVNSICFIFPLCKEPNALKSINNIVASKDIYIYIYIYIYIQTSVCIYKFKISLVYIK